MDQGEKLRLRIQLVDRLEYLFSAAVADQPVVDECDLHRPALYHAANAEPGWRSCANWRACDEGADRPANGARKASRHRALRFRARPKTALPPAFLGVRRPHRSGRDS